MKKLCVFFGTALVASSLFAGSVTNGVTWNIPWGDAWRKAAETTLTAYETVINTIFSGDADVIVKSVTVNDSADIGTNLAVGGKTSLAGELEVNASDVDINMTLTNNAITIDQTNAAGKADVPLIDITDARTGGNADVAAEASLVITAAGAYGLSVADGIVNIEGEIDAAGDITLDPAGDDVIIDGTVDATAYTADAGSGIDVKSAGALDIGNTTATSIDYGSASVTAHTFTSSTGGTAAFVVPDTSIGDAEINDMSAAKLSAGTTASAIDLASCTNLPKVGLVTAVQDSLDLADTATQPGDDWTNTVNAIAVATVTDGAALGATALQPGVITCTGVTNGITNCVVTFANTLASATTLTGWISETAGGAGTAVSLNAVSAGANTVLLSASDESTVVFTGHTDGAAELDITVSAAVTRYFNVVQRDGAIKSSAAMIFDGP